MAKVPSQFSNSLALPGNVVLSPEIDSLDPDRLRKAFRDLKKANQNVAVKQAELNAALAERSLANGIKAAFITKVDLSEIISTVLLTGCSITKAFNIREVQAGHSQDWAKRTIMHTPDRFVVQNAMQMLKPPVIAIIQQMKKYKLLDVKQMHKAGTYSAALNGLKKQLAISNLLQEKDLEIKRINTLLSNKVGLDWKRVALSHKKSGLTIASIAKLVGKGRTTVSNYLNEPSIRSQW